MEPFELLETDQKLLEALKQGDENAFNTIYNEHCMKLLSVAYNSTGSPDVADEIVQEIFVSLWIKRKSLVITQSFKAYLIGAVRNKAFDYIDKQTVRNHYKHTVIKTTSVAKNTTEETVEYDDLNSAINKEIQTLSETTRRIFILSRYNGFTNSEIAKQYHLSIKAVEYHLTKALKHLRLHLNM